MEKCLYSFHSLMENPCRNHAGTQTIQTYPPRAQQISRHRLRGDNIWSFRFLLNFQQIQYFFLFWTENVKVINEFFNTYRFLFVFTSKFGSKSWQILLIELKVYPWKVFPMCFLGKSDNIDSDKHLVSSGTPI